MNAFACTGMKLRLGGEIGMSVMNLAHAGMNAFMTRSNGRHPVLVYHASGTFWNTLLTMSRSGRTGGKWQHTGPSGHGDHGRRIFAEAPGSPCKSLRVLWAQDRDEPEGATWRQ